MMFVVNRIPKIQLDEEGAKVIDFINKDIRLSHISFSYVNKKNKVLDNVSITIPHGKTVALVGPSGSGKSTIAKLIERFYDPTDGTISIGEDDLKSINLRSYRKRIGYVGQEPCLFHDTIKENLLASNPEATDEDI